MLAGVTPMCSFVEDLFSWPQWGASRLDPIEYANAQASSLNGPHSGDVRSRPTQNGHTTRSNHSNLVGKPWQLDLRESLFWHWIPRSQLARDLQRVLEVEPRATTTS